MIRAFFLIMVDCVMKLTPCSWLQVVDCRVCGDPNSILRFAFIEFTDDGNVAAKCCSYAVIIIDISLY